jgi:hypothetical protein
MAKCKTCNTDEPIWAWQPFGPDDKGITALLGSHYRGFPVIPICNQCKSDADAGIPLEFIYKKERYIGNHIDFHHVPSYIDDSLWFWERGGLPF